MNHQLWNRVAARVLAMMFIVAGAAACDRHPDGAQVSAANDKSGLPASADASTRTIDVPAAKPTGDPPGTTPVSPDGWGLSKQNQQTGPREGDDHSYSSVSPGNAQKAQGVDAQQTPDRSDANKPEGQPK